MPDLLENGSQVILFTLKKATFMRKYSIQNWNQKSYISFKNKNSENDSKYTGKKWKLWQAAS